MKIKYLKTDGVKFSAIDVPVNVCGREAHLVIPFVCATKHVKNEIGRNINIAYSVGLNEEKERLIIKYYNEYLIRMALYEIYKDRERKHILREAFYRNDAYFNEWFEGNFFESLGLRAYSSYGAVEIVCKLLKNFSDYEKENWCVEYIDKYFESKKISKKWNGFADNVEDMRLLQELEEKDITDIYINDVLNNDDWYKRFTKLILIPYIKEVKENTRKNEERKKIENEVAELERQRAELNEKIALREKYLSEL